MGYDVVDSKYNGTIGGDEVLEVNVMQAKGVQDKYWDRTYNYVSDVLDTAFNEDLVPATIARKYTTDYDIDCNNKFSSGNTFLDDNSLGDGQYLWVVTCDAAVAARRGAWGGRRQGFIGTNRYPTVHETAFSGVHEALHPYIYSEICDKIQNNLAEDPTDHPLGKVINDGSLFNPNRATIMLGHYGKDVATASKKCTRYKDVDGYDITLSDCSKTALEYSWKHAAGKH